MGTLSKKVFRAVDDIPAKAAKAKYKIGENIAIVKKRKIYNKVTWNSERTAEFNAYWRKWGGMKPYWHKLYQSMNGVFDVKYFPEKLYSTKLEPMLNPWIYSKIFSDKNMIDLFFGGMDEVYIPRKYLSCINGVFFDNEGNAVSEKIAYECVKNIGDCILKPTIDSSSGSGVKRYNFFDGLDTLTGNQVNTIISESGNNFVVQEVVTNNSSIKALHPNSLNTLRVITYRVNDRINYAPLTLRVGVGDSVVDNIHAGGLCVGVNIDGTLKERAYRLGWGDNSDFFLNHPTTGIQFNDYYIGNVQKLIEVAKALHGKVQQLGMVSWDLTINSDEKIVLIEANCYGQSVWFPQVINGQSLFGNDTEYFLEKIANKK